MFNKRSRLQTSIMLILGVMLLLACSFGGSSDDEAQALKDQVSALETQNAILKDEGAVASAPESPAADTGEVQAPPPPSAESAPELEIAEPAVESLPTGPVSAGTPIIYDGWSMLVSKELTVNTGRENWGVKIVLRNLGDAKRVFRFTNAGVTAKDNLGNEYRPSTVGAGMDEDCEEAYHRVKNLEVIAGQSVDILSQSLGYNNCDSTKGIQMFDGTIPLETSQLILHFENFGPYSGVDVVIDL